MKHPFNNAIGKSSILMPKLYHIIPRELMPKLAA